MQYFSSLPSITQKDNNGNFITVSNIISRCYLLSQLKNNNVLFYKYIIKDVDSPENIAYRYYNDLDRYWMIMYANNIMDPQWDWVQTDKVLISFIVNKYKSETASSLDIDVANVTSSMVLSYATATVHHYEKTVTTYDSSGTQKQTITIQIDEDTYNSTDEETQQSILNGVTITKEITTQAVSIYNYETDLNESKRNIYLIKDIYAADMEKQFTSLMRV